MTKREREIIKLSGEEIAETFLTTSGPWDVRFEGIEVDTYTQVDDYLIEGDGEWHAVILNRKSDNRFFKFEWGEGSYRNFYVDNLKEVFPKSTIKYE